MPFDFEDLSEEQQYDLLQAVVEEARGRFDHDGDADYVFQEEAGRVNLVGARGLDDGRPVENDNEDFDDRMFVVYRDGSGRKRVASFELTTEFGSVGTAYLMLGMHQYHFNVHHGNRTRIKISRETYPDSRVGYRALRPMFEGDAGVQILRDKNRNLRKDKGEESKRNVTINIHFGGSVDWSEGCQVIEGWDEYKRFMRLVEQDHSIKGTINNELAPVPATDGTRPVIYTLVEGVFIEQVYYRLGSIFLPRLGPGAAPAEASAEALDELFTLSEVGDGFFPVGANSIWHGGVHLPGPGRGGSAGPPWSRRSPGVS